MEEAWCLELDRKVVGCKKDIADQKVKPSVDTWRLEHHAGSGMASVTGFTDGLEYLGAARESFE